MRKLLVIATLAAAAAGLALIYGCASRHGSVTPPPNCDDALNAWMNACGYRVALNDVDDTSFEDALASCVNTWGSIWWTLVYCYNEVYLLDNNSCEEYAKCAPTHAFYSDDDDDVSPDDDASPDDDVSPDDDASPTSLNAGDAALE